MLQKAIEEGGRFFIGGSRGRRAADLRVGQCGPHSRDGKVVELEILFGCAMPIADVRLIPDFEVPGADPLAAVALDKMFGVFADQLAPQFVIPGRIIRCATHCRPGIVELVFADARNRCGQIPRHESEFHHRPYAGLPKRVECLIGDGEVIDWFPIVVEAEDIRRAPLELGHAVA